MGMAQRIAIWYGTDKDLERLKMAVARNCECRVSAVEDTNPMPAICPAHSMLADQSTLDHLVFVATRREQFLHAEFDPSGEWW